MKHLVHTLSAHKCAFRKDGRFHNHTYRKSAHAKALRRIIKSYERIYQLPEAGWMCDYATP